ncbi:hypothetical protein [Pseudodesulfovibrio sediminis]|uniref:Uncharacterized protein n=1 Tax=Pseudodesulfovibrio sediminis TaxID=2810563 RepID=A0ABN6ETA6_9BACT|nr:hypothetical protein [Pseudodesulfovibrio sediminis]BCS88326.1 hypothetical protein PSDVSF_15680 [Pseudodesulfovibrio sediminis]
MFLNHIEKTNKPIPSVTDKVADSAVDETRRERIKEKIKLRNLVREYHEAEGEEKEQAFQILRDHLLITPDAPDVTEEVLTSDISAAVVRIRADDDKINNFWKRQMKKSKDSDNPNDALIYDIADISLKLRQTHLELLEEMNLHPKQAEQMVLRMSVLAYFKLLEKHL